MNKPYVCFLLGNGKSYHNECKVKIKLLPRDKNKNWLKRFLFGENSDRVYQVTIAIPIELPSSNKSYWVGFYKNKHDPASEALFFGYCKVITIVGGITVLEYTGKLERDKSNG